MKKLKITSILVLSLILMIGCVNTQEPVVDEEESKIEYTYNTTTIESIDNEAVVNWYENNAQTYGFYRYEVDETLQYVLIAAGERRTGGYSLSIDDVTLEETTLTFDVVLNEPGEDEMVTQALTYPNLLVKVESSEPLTLEANLNFEESNQSSDNNEMNQSDQLMEEYHATKFEDFEALKSFIDANIAKVNTSAADRMVIDLFERIKMKHFPAFNEYLFTGEETSPNNQLFQIIDNNDESFDNRGRIFSGDKDLLLEMIEDESLKEQVSTYFNRYLGLSSQEGAYYAVLDYYEIQNDYGRYISDAFKEFNNLMIEQIEKPLAVDGHLNVSVEELVDRVATFEMYMKNNGDFQLAGDLKNFYMTGIYKLVNPSPAEGTLTEDYQPTEALMDGYDELKSNSELKVTNVAVNEILEFINNQPDQVLGSYQDTQALNQKANEIHQKILKMIDDEYLRQYDEATKEEILSKSEEVLTLLKNKDYDALASYVHPEKGLRFSPYTYVDLNNDIVLTRNDLNASAIGEEQYIWGRTDGKGDPIELTVNDYIDRYVYNKDYLTAEEVFFNQKFQRGNSLNNVFSVYSQGMVVEYYLPGSEEYSGMDWGSIKLVFEEHESNYYLIAVVHSEWTI